ncbi:hypothetical protein ABIF61_005224 [Bradyrhizobium japonicum]
MTSRSRSAFSPGFCFASGALRNRKGAGKAGYRLAPASPCAMMRKSTLTGETQVQPDNRPSLRSGLTAYVALSPGSDALLPPSPREIADVRYPVGHAHHRGDLTPACGRQDHTILPYAAPLHPSGFAGHGRAVVPRPLIAHGDYPPCDRIWRQHRPRPPQLTPRTVTIATRPFRQDEMAREYRVCRGSGK